MTRGLASALAWGFAAALVMVAGGLFLRQDFARRTAQLERAALTREATVASAALAAREAGELRLLGEVCGRDLHVERLTLELAAGGSEGGAERVAESLASALGHPVLVLRSAGQRPAELLAHSPGADRLALSGAQLEAARSGYVPVSGRGAAQVLALACARAEGNALLWIATLTKVDELRSVAPDAPWQLLEPAAPRPLGAVTVRELGGASEGLALVLSPRVESAGTEDLALVVAVLAAFVLAASVGFLVGRREADHEAALRTIERAADRVAQGDLVSAIDAQVSERADRTFRTFDRMTKELREMRERLAEAEREAAFRDVARRIAHEIKNPLSPIQISIETLRKARQKQRPDFDEIFEESTRAILEEVKRLEHIVREFGEFARLPKPTPGEIDLGKLVEDVVPLYVPESAELSLRISPDAPRVRADREQITQVLVNLVKNALEAAHDRSPPRVNVFVVPRQDGAAFEVADNGPGIAAEARERVFEPYFTTKSEGTGLGLAIVKRIVSDHAGTIEVGESSLGGASVVVTLPRV